MVWGFSSSVETDAVDTVVAGVTMVIVDVDPEVSTVPATVVEDDRFGTVVQDIDMGQWDAIDKDNGDESVLGLAAVTICVTLVAVQFVIDISLPAVCLTGADF